MYTLHCCFIKYLEIMRGDISAGEKTRITKNLKTLQIFVYMVKNGRNYECWGKSVCHKFAIEQIR